MTKARKMAAKKTAKTAADARLKITATSEGTAVHKARDRDKAAGGQYAF